MKGFFALFSNSAKELKSMRCITITGMFIAVSMILEAYTIPLPFAKVNFAFIAIAIIGMLFGPTVGSFAAMVCDIVGYIAFPQGGFMPVYTAIASLQGLIYGLVLYNKRDSYKILISRKKENKVTDITLALRIIVARLLDVIIINIFINTWANLHYGFISAESYSAAIMLRIPKNVIELIVDFPLLFILLPVTLTAYKRVFGKSVVTVN